MIKILDIYNPNAKTALFVNLNSHRIIEVPIEPYNEKESDCPPENWTNSECPYLYVLRGFGLCGAVGSNEPLKFDKLL